MSDLVAEIWLKLAPLHEVISAIIITLTSAFLLWLFRAKVKLIWGSTSTNFHSFKLLEDGDPVSIWTEKFFVQNAGKKAASNIEIVFSEPLTSYNLWSPRDHSSKLLSNGNFVINIPSLAPRELLIVDMIDIDARSPRLLSVNCPDALSTQVKFLAQRQFGKPVTALVAYLMLSGFVGTVYLLLRLTMGLSQ